MRTRIELMIMSGIASFILFSGTAFAHCDTLDGPVVVAAKKAIEKGDVTPVLKWVQKADEAEIKELFKKTLTLRVAGPEAKELADLYFRETLVRIHRAGEGQPYTGLKPGGHTEPAIVESDKALETGKAAGLIKGVTEEVQAGIRRRFDKALEKKPHAEESVEAGREFVAAYVEFMHYVEGLHEAVKGPGDIHGGHAAHKEAKEAANQPAHAQGGHHMHE